MFYAACVFISVILCFEFHSTYSGWLSGKLKRGVDKPEADTRIEWTSAAEGRAHHSHPDFKWFSDNEQAWAIIDKCKHIADKKGGLGLLCILLLTSPIKWARNNQVLYIRGWPQFMFVVLAWRFARSIFDFVVQAPVCHRLPFAGCYNSRLYRAL